MTTASLPSSTTPAASQPRCATSAWRISTASMSFHSPMAITSENCRHNAAKAESSKFFVSSTDINASGETDAKSSFKTYCTETRRRGLAVVVSDLFDGHGFEAALDVLAPFSSRHLRRTHCEP